MTRKMTPQYFEEALRRAHLEDPFVLHGHLPAVRQSRSGCCPILAVANEGRRAAGARSYNGMDNPMFVDVAAFLGIPSSIARAADSPHGPGRRKLLSVLGLEEVR